MYLGKIRIFAHKLDMPEKSWGDEYEILQHDTWQDGLISDIDVGKECPNYIDEYVSNINLSDDLHNLSELDIYEAGDVIEVVGDYHEETTQSYEGEWDSESWIENVKHRKLNAKQAEAFADFYPEDLKKPLDKKTN